MPGRSFFRERENLALRLDEVIRGYLSDTQVPPVTDTAEKVYGEFALGKFPETREMRFFLGELTCFTPEFANRLMRVVGREFKKWAVVPQYGERAFVVTVEGVDFDGERVSGSVSSDALAYVTWLDRSKEYDERTFGPLRRQLSFLRPLICDVAAAKPDTAVRLAAFDTFIPPFSKGGTVLWVLAPGPSNVGKAAEAKADWKTAVTADGLIRPRYCQEYFPSTDIPAPFHLCAFEIRVEETVLELTSKDGTGVAYIPVGNVVSDQSLKNHPSDSV